MFDLEIVAENLRKNNMAAFVVANKAEALALAKTLVKKGNKVGAGGSETLTQCGVIDFLNCGDFDFLERKNGMSQAEQEKVFEAERNADVFFASSNAITEAGELYNVDGRANRLASIAHGSKSVVLIAGKNKIVNNVVGAVERVKTVCAPQNAKRLNCNTPCSRTGHCISIDENRPFATDGCTSPDRICCQYLISGWQRQKGRITVILVNEDLGF